MEFKNILLKKFKKFIDFKVLILMISILEVIVRQMTRKVKVEDSGDTDLLPGSYDRYVWLWRRKCKKLIAEGVRPAAGKRAITWYY